MSASIWLLDLGVYSLQIALLAGTGALVARLLPLGSPAAALGYWRALLAACLLLPFVQPWRESAPPLSGAIPVVLAPRAAVTSSGGTTAPRSQDLRLEKAALAVVGAGVAARMLWLGMGFLGLARMRRRSRPLLPLPSCVERAEQRIGAAAAFLTSDRVSSPITFGMLHPVIIVPPSVVAMGPDLQEPIVSHELLHVRRRDWVFEVAEECVRALLWFHPSIWWLIGRIQLSREQVVDQAVIRLTERREQYVEALIAVASGGSRTRFAPAPPLLRKSRLKERVGEIWRETNMSKRRLIFSVVTSSTVLLLVAWAAVQTFPLQALAQERTVAIELMFEPEDDAVQVLRGSDNLLHKTPVEYPRRARERRIEGDVLLEVRVDERGMVSDARVLDGPEELRKAALQSVLRWHYAPQPGTTQVLLAFRLPAQGATPQSVEYNGQRHAYVVADDAKHREHLARELEARQAAAALSLTDAEKLKAELEARVKDELKLDGRLRDELKAKALLSDELEMRAKAEWKAREAAVKLERELHEVEIQAGAGRDDNMVRLRTKIADLERTAGPRAPRDVRLPLRLSAIRAERISESVLALLTPRLGVQVGSLVTEETLHRVREAVREFDEHFRVVFHTDSDGSVELVIVAP